VAPIKTRTLLLYLPLALVSCASPVTVVSPGEPCATEGFAVVDGFSGARRGTCRITGGEAVTLEIRREDEQVKNPSPWYAFKVVPDGSLRAVITLDYDTWKHRYPPKVSDDGLNWRALPEHYVTVADDERTATMRLPLDGQTVWVSAQELVTPPVYRIWSQDVANRTAADLGVLGESLRRQSILRLDTNSSAQEVVLLIGRQHPPEVSGSFAFFRFFETLHADTVLAREFRQRFRIIAIPLLNPDGVAGGNWRHNLGEKDLNRDWGPFTQPETKLVAELLDDLDASGSKLRVFLDFHSTDENLFYTQEAGDVTEPPNFAIDWFAAARPRLANYPFKNEARPTTNETIGKNYIYLRYGIPAFTYEVGDETNRDAARQAAEVFAEEFMRLLLSQ